MIELQSISEANVISVENHIKSSPKDELLPLDEMTLRSIHAMMPVQVLEEFKLLFGEDMQGMTAFEYAMICLKYKDGKTLKKMINKRQRIVLLFVEKFPPNTIASIRWGNHNTSLHLASFLGLPELVEPILQKLPILSKQKNGLHYTPLDVSVDEQTRNIFKQFAGPKAIQRRLSERQGPLRTKTTTFEGLMDPSLKLNKRLSGSFMDMNLFNETQQQQQQEREREEEIKENKKIELMTSKNQHHHHEKRTVQDDLEKKVVSGSPFVLADKKTTGTRTFERNIIEKLQQDEEKVNWKHKRSLPDLWQQKVRQAEEERLREKQLEEEEEARRKNMLMQQNEEQKTLDSSSHDDQHDNSSIMELNGSCSSTSSEKKANNNISWKERRSLQNVFEIHEQPQMPHVGQSVEQPLSNELKIEMKQKESHECEKVGLSDLLSKEDNIEEESIIALAVESVQRNSLSESDLQNSKTKEVLDKEEYLETELETLISIPGLSSFTDFSLKMPDLQFESLLPESDDWFKDIMPEIKNQTVEKSVEMKPVNLESKDEKSQYEVDSFTHDKARLPANVPAELKPKDSKIDVSADEPELFSQVSKYIEHSVQLEKQIKEKKDNVTDFKNRSFSSTVSVLKEEHQKSLVEKSRFTTKKKKSVKFDNAWSGNLEKRIYIDVDSPVQPYSQNSLGTVLVQVQEFQLAPQRLLPLELAGADCEVFLDFQIGENKTIKRSLELAVSETSTQVKIEDNIIVPFEAPIILYLIARIKKNNNKIKSSVLKSSAKFLGSLGRKKTFTQSVSSLSLFDEKTNMLEFDCTVFIPIQELMDVSSIGKIKTLSHPLKFKNIHPNSPAAEFNASLTWQAAFLPHLSNVEDVFVPKTLTECANSWRNRADYSPVQMSGDLIQTGGDLIEPVKRYFKLYGQYMASNSSNKDIVNIDISMISSIQSGGAFIDYEDLDGAEDTQFALAKFFNTPYQILTSSFTMTFKDDEDIHFDAEDYTKMLEWVRAITEVKRRLLLGLVDPWLDALDNYMTKI